jgi:hypothetical protein
MTTTYSNVSSAATLSADIKAIDLASQADGGNGTHYSITLKAGATLTEAAQLSAVNLAAGDTLTIKGAGSTLDGGHRYNGLFVYSGAVTIQNLTIANAKAVGGAGGPGGTGVAGAVAALSGATFAPGDSGPGVITAASLTLDSGSAFKEAIGGSSPGAGGYSQTVVQSGGTVTLGGALDLAFVNGFKPKAGETFTLVDNATGNAVMGAFMNVSPTGYFESGGLLGN